MNRHRIPIKKTVRSTDQLPEWLGEIMMDPPKVPDIIVGIGTRQTVKMRFPIVPGDIKLHGLVRLRGGRIGMICSDHTEVHGDKGYWCTMPKSEPVFRQDHELLRTKLHLGKFRLTVSGHCYPNVRAQLLKDFMAGKIDRATEVEIITEGDLLVSVIYLGTEIKAEIKRYDNNNERGNQTVQLFRRREPRPKR